jgi:hypothetical protein
MKNKFIICGALALTLGSAHGAIGFSTTAAVGLKGSAVIPANVTTGSLGLLIVDSGNNGFLDLAQTGGAITAGSTSALATRKINATDASITANGFFGGDLILGTFSTANGGSAAPAFSGSIEGYEGQKFAIVWFEKSAATLASSRSGEYFGIASGADWTLPATDSGNYTFSGTTNTTTSVYWQLASTTNATQLGSAGFFSGTGSTGTSDVVKTAAFQVIPEPSAALLGAVGALVLLRRRRN